MKVSKKGWFITLTGSLFFFYAFIQANVMASLNMEILRDFDISSSAMSLMTACYFYANIIFIIPAGLMLDRFSVKKLMLITILIAVLGTFVMSISDDIVLASFGRVLCGIMMAFGLISCLKLASLWIPTDKMAIASSLVITIGMFGGIFSHTVMANIIDHCGWRCALLYLALFGIFIAFVLFFVIKEPKKEGKKEKMESVWKSLAKVFKVGQNWYCGFFTSLLNFPVAILGALFGISYLVQARGVEYVQASFITSMLFLGMIVGSPFFGTVSDFFKRRKMPMYIGGISCLFFVLLLIFAPTNSPLFLFLVFFLVGFTSAAQVIGYPTINESNPPKYAATALSLAAFIIMGLGYGVGLPFVGWLLDVMWQGKEVNGLNVYSKGTYDLAFLTLPVGIFISLIMALLIKETKCRNISK